MKTSRCKFVSLFLIAIAGSVAVSATANAGANSAQLTNVNFSDNARLLVWRAADFGTVIYLNIFVDGVKVTTLGRNEGFEAILRPGRHVLSIGTSPCPYGQTKFSYRQVNVRRGETYAFTALWEGGDRAVLDVSDAANRVAYWPNKMPL